MPTQEQQDEAVRLAREGRSFSEICRATGLTDKQARAACRKAGVEKMALVRARRALVWTPELEAEVERLWEDEGLADIAISQRMGLSRELVRVKVNQLGLYRERPADLARLSRPDETHRRAAMARLRMEPDEAARYPRRVALVAAAIAWRQQA